jgi:hypothetical protein
MKKLLFIFCLFISQLNSIAQAQGFEGVLVYGRKFYNNSKRIDSVDPNIPPTISYTVKGNLTLAEISTEKDFMSAMNYSVIVDSEKKEATMLARIANEKMAIKFEDSFFNEKKLYKVISPAEIQTRIIAGLKCKLGYALAESEFGTTDSLRVWYTEEFRNIPYLFETTGAPGLIVSMQQDDLSYWELEEMKPLTVDPLVFSIPKEYLPMTPNELQDFISTMDQLEIEEEIAPSKKEGNEIIHEEED